MPIRTANPHDEPAVSAPAPAWGRRGPDAGRAGHVEPGIEYQGTTVQLCGLYPFVAGSGTPAAGTPIGRHLLNGEPACLDPLDWLRAGLVTNPGMFLLGQPGVGKSAFVKRLLLGATAVGRHGLILGDTKGEYTPLVQRLGGQVIPVGRGLHRINPLDTGPLGAALTRLSGPDADRLRLEIRGRRLSLLLGLCTLVRNGRVSNAEEVLLGRTVDLLTDRLDRQPTIPDVLAVLADRPDELRTAARVAADGDPRVAVAELVPTLTLLCEGTLKGIFDGPTTAPINLDTPAVSVDISRIASAGDQLVAAAMLSVWAYGFATVDAAAALADHGAAPRRHWLAVMDELWRALRGAPGLVDHADSLTRLNRQRGLATVMITHSLDDLDALPRPEDRAKARGFVERAAIKVLAALPGRELDRISAITHLTAAERTLVSSWAAPEAVLPGTVHPGRGKVLIKTGERPGLPVALALDAEEVALYDTDHATRDAPNLPTPAAQRRVVSGRPERGSR